MFEYKKVICIENFHDPSGKSLIKGTIYYRRSAFFNTDSFYGIYYNTDNFENYKNLVLNIEKIFYKDYLISYKRYMKRNINNLLENA